MGDRDTIDDIEASIDNIAEMTRTLRLLRGVPDGPEPTADELRAETMRMRAENDQLDAKLRGRHRTYD